MPVLYKASFGYLLRHPWQLALALTGICIGVAVMVAVDLANSSSRKAFQLSMSAVNGQATHQVIGGPRGVDESIYARLRVEQGVRAIAPIVAGYVELNGNTIQVLGVDVFAEHNFRNYALPASVPQKSGAPDNQPAFDEASIRRFLTEPGAALMSASMALSTKLSIRDAFVIRSSGKDHPAILAGLINSGSLDNLLVVDIATAQHWFGRFGFLSHG